MNKCWICSSDKTTEINIVSDKKVKHLLCNECYFLFSKTNKLKKIRYYSSSYGSGLTNRYLSNEYFDTARFMNYIDLVIQKNCKLNDKINHLDIGGGFGFFSKVLKKKFPNINSFSLEPDKDASKIAKKFNKNLKVINLPFEDINLIKNTKFDLVTYWGGIYRTIKPNKVFQDLKKICNKNCDFFFSLPTTLDDLRIQHLEINNSFDNYLLTDDSAQSLFGRNHMKLFLSKNKFFFKETVIQNRPFKKKIPIFFFNQKNKITNLKLQKKELKKSFIKSIGIYNNYFQEQIKKIINKQSKINKILIFGDNFLSKYALNYLKNKKYKNITNIKGNLEYLYNDPEQLKTILNLANMKSSIFFVFENPNDGKIKKSLINRLHVNIDNNLFFLNDHFEFQKDIFSFQKNEFLKKKINLIKVNDI